MLPCICFFCYYMPVAWRSPYFVFFSLGWGKVRSMSSPLYGAGGGLRNGSLYYIFIFTGT